MVKAGVAMRTKSGEVFPRTLPQAKVDVEMVFILAAALFL